MLEYWTSGAEAHDRCKEWEFHIQFSQYAAIEKQKVEGRRRDGYRENIKYKIDEVKVLGVVCCLVTYALWKGTWKLSE